jgi:hypothetical protein
MIVAHQPLSDNLIQAEIFDSLKLVDQTNTLLTNWNPTLYFDSFQQWIYKSSYTKIHGLDQFKHLAYCAGTYDGIQAFVHRHVTTRRIRFSQAEFVGSKIVCNNARASWKYLEHAPLDKNDALVLSLPFAGNGNMHPDHCELISTCAKLQIPVLLDLAYFGISTGLDIDLTHECITDVVFSLSKPMSAQLRLGLRFTRDLHDDVIQVLSDNNTYNRIAVAVGVNLLDKFSHDWIVERYWDKHKEICNKHHIEPTATLTLALGNAQHHSQFWREGYYRICITDELHNNI